MIGLAAGAVVALLLASALLSAAETAAFSLSESRVRTLRDEGFRGAAELAQLRSRPGTIQAAVYLVVTLVNAFATGAGVAAGALLWGLRGALVALLLALLAVLLLAEIAPRVLAARRPIRVALASAPLLLVLERVARVLLSPFLRLEDFLSGRGEEQTPEEREVRELSQIGQQAGIVDLDEQLLVERAFRMDELTAWDVMTPRVDIFAWKASRTLEQIVGELPKVPYSRVPVFSESIDDITGVVYVREAYEAYVRGERDLPLARLAHDPLFVPGSLSLSQLVRSFQASRVHMGIVADEFGGTDGLVTLEDVLEELVGPIVDETDVAEEPLLQVNGDELVADAAVDLREINYAFNIALPQLEHRSLNGFILEELGHVPAAGERFQSGGVEIEVLAATETQVLRARVRRLSRDEAERAEADEEAEVEAERAGREERAEAAEETPWR